MDDEWIKVGTLSIEPPQLRALLLHLKNQIDIARMQFTRLREDKAKTDALFQKEKDYRALMQNTKGSDYENNWQMVLATGQEHQKAHAVYFADLQFLTIILARIQLMFEQINKVLNNQDLKDLYLKHEPWLHDANCSRNLMEHIEKEIKKGNVDLGPYAIGLGYEFTANMQLQQSHGFNEVEMNEMFKNLLAILCRLFQS